MNNEQVSKVPDKATQVRSLLSQDNVKLQIAKALPDICKPERFMRIAITAITKNPKLADCTQASLMGCLLDLAQLGIEADVEMPGFVSNPLQYMARASVFVLSSEYEGLPGVLIQAMACGCPVVSTDCPGGSREILADGKYGALVGVGDADVMSDAVLAQLDKPMAREVLLQRAEEFSVESAVNHYLELLDSVVEQAADRQ